MLGSSVVDVVVGLILLYLLSSVAASALNEVAEGILRRRSKYLRVTIAKITDSDLADELYQTSWLSSISEYSHSLNAPERVTRVFGKKLPSYIPSEMFASAVRELIEDFTRKVEDALIALDDGEEAGKVVELLPPRFRRALERHLDVPDLLAAVNLDVARLRDGIVRLMPIVSQEIVELFPRGVLDDLDGEALRLRQWYDDIMDRMSGWYGRQTKWLLLVWGIVLAGFLNIDTFTIAGTLWNDDVARQAAVASAQAAVEGGEVGDCQGTEDDPYQCVDAAIEEIRKAQTLGIPLGWPDWPWNWGDYNDVAAEPDGGKTPTEDPRIPIGIGRWFVKIVGLLVTGGAVAMGAPFWFDILNKFVNFRAAGPKPASTTSSNAGRSS